MASEPDMSMMVIPKRKAAMAFGAESDHDHVNLLEQPASTSTPAPTVPNATEDYFDELFPGSDPNEEEVEDQGKEEENKEEEDTEDEKDKEEEKMDIYDQLISSSDDDDDGDDEDHEINRTGFGYSKKMKRNIPSTNNRAPTHRPMQKEVKQSLSSSSVQLDDVHVSSIRSPTTTVKPPTHPRLTSARQVFFLKIHLFDEVNHIYSYFINDMQNYA